MAFSSREPLFNQVHWLLDTMAKSPPTVFVVNLSIAGYIATRWVKRAGIPVIGILHSDDLFYRKVLSEFALGSAGNCVSEMVCVSDYLSGIARASGTSVPVHSVPYGVPVPAQAAKPATGTLRMIYVGRLVEEQKQIMALTQALCRVVQNIPGSEAVIYGNGPERDRVTRYIEQQNLNDRVWLGGQIDNAQIQSVMCKAQILVLLSDYEGLPIALLEAMACGLVPICLQIRSGVGQLIDHGTTGFLVEDRHHALIACVQALASCATLWSDISKAAREKIIENYSNEANADKWLELLTTSSERAPVADESSQSLQKSIRTLNFLKTSFEKKNNSIMAAK
jgi:glycosyltransferase involved in cell wall biosynthesis